MVSNRRSLLYSIILTCLVMLILVGCDLPGTTDTPEATAVASPSPETEPTIIAEATVAPEVTVIPPQVTPSPGPAVPRGGTLPVRLTEPIDEFRPWDLRSRGEEYVAELLYNGLVQLDDTMRPQPDLAETWTTAPDGETITFTLRTDVVWHDGTPLTTDDVVWTLNALRSITATNSLVADLQGLLGEIGMPLTDTVVISLTRPYAPILSNLAVPILPRHRLQDRTPEAFADLNFWDEPIGSGPFVLGERTEQGITFARNEQYFGGAPNLDGIALVIAPDEIVAVQALNDGALMLAEFPPTSTVVGEASELDPSLRVGAYAENGTYFVALNVREGRFFSDARLRQALALAVDLPEVVAESAGANARPIATSLSPAAWPYTEELGPRQVDLDQARQLLEDAGWSIPEGETVRVRDGVELAARMYVRGDDPRRVEAAERVAAATEQIGMRLEVVPADFDTVILARIAPPTTLTCCSDPGSTLPTVSAFQRTASMIPMIMLSSARTMCEAGQTIRAKVCVTSAALPIPPMRKQPKRRAQPTTRSNEARRLSRHRQRSGRKFRTCSCGLTRSRP